MLCISQIPSSHRGEGTVSTPHPQCELSRPPVGGGCDGAWGGVSGSGGTCYLVGLRSGAGRPGPSPRRGSPHPPPLTRGHCCTEGFHCPPVGSWCCSLERNTTNKSLRTSRVGRGHLRFLGHQGCSYLCATRMWTLAGSHHMVTWHTFKDILCWLFHS